MPTLQFKGRNIIWNHHLTVPYHTLDEDTALSFDPKKGDGNIIVEGDNLTALKALLPQYAGKIKCIYIDPPYNTGNEGWVYNDKVNSPLINDWLGKTVGTDDLTRHDKWLCMMVPRLQLLRELLSDDGAIFISCDDNEQHNLRSILDDVFGQNNFIQNIIWQKKFSPQNDAKYFSDNHDFIICYAKNKVAGDVSIGWSRNLMARTEDQDNRYSNPDNDPRGPWASSDMTVRTYTPDYDYEITTPSGRIIKPTNGRCWFTSKENFENLVEEDRIWYGENGNNVPRIKKFLSEVQDGIVPVSVWLHSEVGHNQQAKQELKKIFDDVELPFETPKPVSLIKHIIKIAANENDIILDSFAGSGTTGQAVLELNKEDGGNRKFILVQMTEATDAEPNKNIAKDITAERIKRAITKYDLNSGFAYYKLGTAIDAETLLQGNLPTYEQFAKYVFYLCTGQHHSKPKEIKPKDYFVGNAGNTAIYLIYEQDFEKLTQLALNLSLAEKFRKASANKPVVVYAPACFLDEEYLQDFNMQFVSIPYNLFQKNEQP